MEKIPMQGTSGYLAKDDNRCKYRIWVGMGMGRTKEENNQ